MAKVSITEFDGKRKVAGTAGSAGAQPAGLYFALDTRYQWQGPFTFAELAALPWFSALTWISNGGGTMEKASAIPGLSDIFMQRVASEENVATGSLCPICRHPLVVRSFEKTQVSQCTFCGGTMIDNDKISRVLARSDGGCPDRIKALARDTMKENQIRSITRKTRGEEQKMPLLHCPKCGNNMTRTFYSLAYLVEIDRCSWCDISWFDRDELAMLQCMISTRMASENLLGKEMPIQ
jgi:Zn-finger nucleic acid-binding protein